MGLANIDVNIWAILLSAVVSMVLGAIWYSPLLFGNSWMKLMGLSMKKIEKMKKETQKGKLYLVNFIAVLVTVIVLSLFVGSLGVSGFTAGAILGFWVWLGFIAPVLLGGILWENKPVTLYLINAGYQLVNSLLIGGILAAL